MADVLDSHLKEINTQGKGCRKGGTGLAVAPGTGLADEAAVCVYSDAVQPQGGGCLLLTWPRLAGCCMGTPFLCRQQVMFGMALVLSCSWILSPSLTCFHKLRAL